MTVHGVMTCVSPVRKGRKNGAVKYSTERLQMGVEPCVSSALMQNYVRAALLKSVEEKTAIAIKNCHVQKSHSSGGDELEIVIDSSTKVDDSPVDIDITTLPPIWFSTLDAILLTSLFSIYDTFCTLAIHDNRRLFLMISLSLSDVINGI
jgi:hypothetical protein